MYQLVLTFLAAILAGFALVNLPTSALVPQGMGTFFTSFGGLVIITFSLALIYLALKSLLNMFKGA